MGDKLVEGRKRNDGGEITDALMAIRESRVDLMSLIHLMYLMHGRQTVELG